MSFPSRAFVVDSDVLVAAVGLWSSDGDWKNWYLSPHWGPRRHQAPLPSLWNLSPLVTGRPYNTQSFVSDSIVGGRLRGKKGVALGIEKQGETKRSGSVVWRGQGRIKGLGADLRPLSFRQSWLHLTSLWRPPKPTGISCYTGAMPYGDSVSLQALLLSLCLHFHPIHPGQYHRWKWLGGVGVYMRFAPTCQGSTTKTAEPSLRMPSGQVLPYFGAFTWPFLLPCPGSTGRTTAWRESEQRGALSLSTGDAKPQLCGKQRWT